MSLLSECYRRLSDVGTPKQLKGYKVTDVSRTKKIGVACRSLQELKRKACTKLNVMHDSAEIGIFLMDGSEIDEEYFSTLEPQTTLILRKPGEEILTEADILYDMLRKVHADFLKSGDRATQFLMEKLKVKVATLYRALNNNDDKTLFSRREEHPEWFEGLETNARTKEAYMHRRCQDRIRGYLYKTIEQIKSSDVYANDPKARRQLMRAISYFKLQLKEDHHFGHYFDRSRAADIVASSDEDDDIDGPRNECYDHCPCKLRLFLSDIRLLGLDEDEVDARKVERVGKKLNDSLSVAIEDYDEDLKCPFTIQPSRRQELVSLCNKKGEFKCRGIWNRDKCSYGSKHKINPYRSKEELILFSTWNLDHKIERSRTLVPQLLEASKRDEITEKDVADFYDKLFTDKNLRLVHIVCHDKGSHK